MQELCLAATPENNCVETIEMPSYTGERNHLKLYPKGVVLCLGPSLELALQQAKIAKKYGNATLIIIPFEHPLIDLNGFFPRPLLNKLQGIDAVALASDEMDMRLTRIALAERKGKIIPLIYEITPNHKYYLERHICTNTTASGGNTSLLAALD